MKAGLAFQCGMYNARQRAKCPMIIEAKIQVTGVVNGESGAQLSAGASAGADPDADAHALLPREPRREGNHRVPVQTARARTAADNSERRSKVYWGSASSASRERGWC